EDGIRDGHVTGVQTCALPILRRRQRLVFGPALKGSGSVRLVAPYVRLASTAPAPLSRCWSCGSRCIARHPSAAGTAGSGGRTSQIGRASCRERVGIAVVA